MTRKILVGVDMSKMESLIAYSHNIAHRLNDEIIYIHVLPRISSIWRGYEPWIPPQIGDEVKQIAHKNILLDSKAEAQLWICLLTNTAS